MDIRSIRYVAGLVFFKQLNFIRNNVFMQYSILFSRALRNSIEIWLRLLGLSRYGRQSRHSLFV